MRRVKHVIGSYKDNELYYMNPKQTTAFVLGYDSSKKSYFYYQTMVIELYLSNKEDKKIRVGYNNSTTGNGNDYIVSLDPDSYGVVLLDKLKTEKPTKSMFSEWNIDTLFAKNNYGNIVTKKLVEVLEKFDEDDVKQADKIINTYGKFNKVDDYKVGISDYIKTGRESKYYIKNTSN